MAALLVVGLGLAGPARADLAVGIGDQKPEMFTDPRFTELGIGQVRRVVAWDALEITWQRRELDAWMHAARAAGVQPLIAFTRSRRSRLIRFLPTPARLGRTFASFRERYPWVRTYTPWNEANTSSQPTWRSPRMAALYYNEMRRGCPACTIVAADVLDIDNMVPWLQEFLRHADGTPLLWGLHNYLDANRFRTSGTEAMLATVPGEIWFTEVGGIVLRRARGNRLSLGPESPRHAARVTSWLFHLAELSPRIRRLYLYHWNSERGRHINWDSGLIDPHGVPRPAFRVLVRELLRLRALSLRAHR
jgi:polysaccharide biosynthesis protein PslG